MLAELWKRFTSMILPRVIPIDPPSEGGSVALLCTLRPTGVLGDRSDSTSILQERTDFDPGTVIFSTIGEMNPDGVLFPANFSHIIIRVRARVADYRLNGEGPLLYANPRISWGWPFTDETQNLVVNYTTVPLWSEFTFGTRSIQLNTDQHGNPWSYEALRGIFAGAYVEHVTTEWGIEGYLDTADVWIEVYGEVDAPIRRRKFVGGDYRLTYNNRSYIATLTADEMRQVYEAARGQTEDLRVVPLTITAMRLDGGRILERNYKVNSTFAAIVAVIEEAKRPQIG